MLSYKKTRAFFTVLFLTGVLVSASAYAAIDALNFASPQQEDDYHQLTQELRCPQCQNNSIADSNATIAVDMRAKVFELLNQGKSKQDIVGYMVERYGNFVTYDPPLTPATMLLWVAPLLLIGSGLLMVWRRQEQKKTSEKNTALSESTSASELSPEQQQRLQALLQEKE